GAAATGMPRAVAVEVADMAKLEHGAHRGNLWCVKAPRTGCNKLGTLGRALRGVPAKMLGFAFGDRFPAIPGMRPNYRRLNSSPLVALLSQWELQAPGA